MRELISGFLRGIDAELTCFDDGSAALDEALASPPALVLTEVLVPVLDGLALCRRLKGSPMTRATRVVVVSMLAAAARAKEAGADAFLLKPLNQRRLLDALGPLGPG